MPDYQLGKIYLITSETNKLLYIGSTAQKYISTRIQGHIRDHKYGSNYCCSYKLLECDDYEYKLLKDFPCSNVEQLRREEGFWILHYKNQSDYECVNKYIAGRTYKEWCETNRDKLKEYQKEWYQKNKDKVLEEMKQYNEQNKDKKKEYDKIYSENNRDKIKEYQKEYNEQNKNKRKEYLKNNKDKIREKKKEYYQNNKDKIKAYQKEYRESKTH
tara:strand:+ start:95 stop:739 length:645 start_codon:yes stop_codon:yes gene_type:complete